MRLGETNSPRSLPEPASGANTDNRRATELRFWAAPIASPSLPIRSLRRHPRQARLDDGLRVADDALHQLLAGGDVVDQAHAGAGGPDAVLQVAGLVDEAALGAGHERADFGNAPA